MRVADFRLALDDADRLHGQEGRIEFVENADGRMTFDALEIVSPAGCTRLADQHVAIAPGEHVLVTGDPNAGKTLFFRAVAGLWPWGGGRIGMPAGASVAFVPRTPYFAPGTLREVLGDPDGDGRKPDDDVLKGVLAEVGLDHLSSSLDRNARWEHELNDDEQRLLMLAATALGRPKWIVIDDALDTLDTDTLKRVLALFRKHLDGAAILNIGRVLPENGFFGRTLTIVKDKAAPALQPARVRPGAIEAPASSGRRVAKAG